MHTKKKSVRNNCKTLNKAFKLKKIVIVQRLTTRIGVTGRQLTLHAINTAFVYEKFTENSHKMGCKLLSFVRDVSSPRVLETELLSTSGGKARRRHEE